MARSRQSSRNIKKNNKSPQSDTSVSARIAHIPNSGNSPEVFSKGPRKAPTQARSKETVEVILTAAQKMFVDLGFAGTTTNKIAARAGVSIGSLYQYFPNKAALFGALFQRQMASRLPAIEGCVRELANPKQPVREGLRRLVEEVVNMHEVSPALHDILMTEAERMPQMQQMKKQAEEAYINLTARVLREITTVRKGKHHLMAAILVQTVEELSHWIVNHQIAGDAREEALDEIVELLHRYVIE